MADSERTEPAARKKSPAPKVEHLVQAKGGTIAPIAAWGFVFLILRIFAVSAYDWQTAFAVSTTLGVSDGLALLFGSLMAGHALVAILLIGVLPLLLSTYLWSPRGRRSVVVLATTLAMVTLVALTVSFQNWWLPLATAALFIIFALIRVLPPGHGLRRFLTGAMSRVGWVSGVAVLVIAAFIQTPWVPKEQIETTDDTFSGYVLSVDSGWVNVLTEDHKFLILKSGDVLSRE